ncbi:MAG: hypothetical protein ACM3JQ_00265 [Candidatus Eiseniibacteriota bacterium]
MDIQDNKSDVNMTESFELAIRKSVRKIIVSLKDIDLLKTSDNFIVIFMVEDSPGSAGGRAAGYGSRRVSEIIIYSSVQGHYSKLFEIDDEISISKFEIPYSAVAMDIQLTDGTSMVVQGIVDPELIQSYMPTIEELTKRNINFNG